jgi:hypothetical protein
VEDYFNKDHLFAYDNCRLFLYNKSNYNTKTKSIDWNSIGRNWAILHTIFILVYLVLCFALFAILDRVIANKTKPLKFELEQNTEDEDEPLSNKEKDLLIKVVLWSRIRLGVGIIMLIGLLLIIYRNIQNV